MKPYFESTRIARDESTQEEFEYLTIILWADVCRIEEPAGDDFKNGNAKCVIFMSTESSIWLLAPYAEVAAQWKAYLDGYLVHSPLRN
ncbi:hypothetical protein BEN47_06125 [Hymenobacter lapidarius]|uniref:Uncharacterized protein n=1 Tax=Hymenobacter lapidarius TaxID=1908237 RepID=A0A1G1SQD3_9BACT|nr:hypothetical protein [Hymenobacter lapidarius]OGX80831.1 hypothetical protein BEN47_06125 [Hymenobacter lapidarius]